MVEGIVRRGGIPGSFFIDVLVALRTELPREGDRDTVVKRRLIFFS